MPFTPFHPVPVWLLWLRFPRRLDFVALTVGAVVPDLLEPVFILFLPGLYWTNRDWSHSLVGAMTYDLAVAVTATYLIARPLLARISQAEPSRFWTHFGGREYGLPSSWQATILSAEIGTLSHLLADLPFHATSPVLFPGMRLQVFPSDVEWLATGIANLLFGAMFVLVLYRHWWRPSRKAPLAGAR